MVKGNISFKYNTIKFFVCLRYIIHILVDKHLRTKINNSHVTNKSITVRQEIKHLTILQKITNFLEIVGGNVIK